MTKLLEEIAANVRDIVYRYQTAGERGFKYVNAAVLTVTGYSIEEHYADADLGFKLIHPDDRHILERAMWDARPGAIKLRWIRKDGTIIWTEQVNVPVYDEDGHMIAIDGVARPLAVAEGRSATQAGTGPQRIVLALAMADKYGLTIRELRVLTCMANGDSAKEIAHVLVISYHTARKHCANILRKLAVSSRAAAVAVAMRDNLLD